MDGGNVTISSTRVRRRTLSLQSGNNIVGLPDYSLKAASPHTAPSMNNQHNHKMNDQIPRTANNPQQPSGAIRIIDRRNRFKQVEREPRSSSVPVCEVRASAGRRNREKASIDESSRTNRTDIVSWNVAEEDPVSSRKSTFAHIERNIQTLRDHFFPPSSQNTLNGKPPPYSSTNHLDFSQDEW